MELLVARDPFNLHGLPRDLRAILSKPEELEANYRSMQSAKCRQTATLWKNSIGNYLQI